MSEPQRSWWADPDAVEHVYVTTKHTAQHLRVTLVLETGDEPPNALSVRPIVAELVIEPNHRLIVGDGGVRVETLGPEVERLEPTAQVPRTTTYRDNAGDFRWRLIAPETGDILADSAQGYSDKRDAAHGLERVTRARAIRVVDRDQRASYEPSGDVSAQPGEESE